MKPFGDSDDSQSKVVVSISVSRLMEASLCFELCSYAYSLLGI